MQLAATPLGLVPVVGVAAVGAVDAAVDAAAVAAAAGVAAAAASAAAEEKAEQPAVLQRLARAFRGGVSTCSSGSLSKASPSELMELSGAD